MKKVIGMTLAAVLAIALLAGCAAPRPAAVSEAATALEANAAPAAQTTMTEADAKAAALRHAGLNEADVTFAQVKLDRDGARAEYEVEFYTTAKEYDYEIDAVTGEVLSCDFDAEHFDRPAAASDVTADATIPAPELDATSSATVKGEQSSATAGISKQITEQEARAIALQDAGLAETDVTFVYAKLDRDDGRDEYEVEFISGNTEYDYEIDAATGKILSKDREAEHTAPSGQDVQSGSAIGEAAAKQIALKHAGFLESEVTRLKVERDTDHGKTVYDVEFDVGRTEYSYEIDAVSGKILEHEAEKDD